MIKYIEKPLVPQLQFRQFILGFVWLFCYSGYVFHSLTMRIFIRTLKESIIQIILKQCFVFIPQGNLRVSRLQLDNVICAAYILSKH